MRAGVTAHNFSRGVSRCALQQRGRGACKRIKLVHIRCGVALVVTSSQGILGMCRPHVSSPHASSPGQWGNQPEARRPDTRNTLLRQRSESLSKGGCDDLYVAALKSSTLDVLTSKSTAPKTSDVPDYPSPVKKLGTSTSLPNLKRIDESSKWVAAKEVTSWPQVLREGAEEEASSTPGIFHTGMQKQASLSRFRDHMCSSRPVRQHPLELDEPAASPNASSPNAIPAMLRLAQMGNGMHERTLAREFHLKTRLRAPPWWMVPADAGTAADSFDDRHLSRYGHADRLVLKMRQRPTDAHQEHLNFSEARSHRTCPPTHACM